MGAAKKQKRTVALSSISLAALAGTMPKHKASYVKRQTSNVKRQTSNVKRQTSQCDPCTDKDLAGLGRAGGGGQGSVIAGEAHAKAHAQTTNHNLIPQTTNHKPQTTNHKPQTTNHKPQTTNHKPHCNAPTITAEALRASVRSLGLDAEGACEDCLWHCGCCICSHCRRCHRLKHNRNYNHPNHRHRASLPPPPPPSPSSSSSSPPPPLSSS